MPELPIACDLPADQLAARRNSLLAALRQRSVEVTPLESGLRLVLANDSEAVTLATEVIRAERVCCRFLRFELRFHENLGPIELDVTGPVGTRVFLESLLPQPD